MSTKWNFIIGWVAWLSCRWPSAAGVVGSTPVRGHGSLAVKVSDVAGMSPVRAQNHKKTVEWGTIRKSLSRGSNVLPWMWCGS
ncbi:hypothetical protein TNCV_4086741 [Trichonephila clavipes]|nr:hypothetical protein TNCV_4086741 [Trichonephila clavipes]